MRPTGMNAQQVVLTGAESRDGELVLINAYAGPSSTDTPVRQKEGAVEGGEDEKEKGRLRSRQMQIKNNEEKREYKEKHQSEVVKDGGKEQTAKEEREMLQCRLVKYGPLCNCLHSYMWHILAIPHKVCRHWQFVLSFLSPLTLRGEPLIFNGTYWAAPRPSFSSHSRVASSCVDSKYSPPSALYASSLGACRGCKQGG